MIETVLAGQPRYGNSGDSGDTFRCVWRCREPVASGGVGGELPVCSHALAGFADVVGADADGFGDGFGWAAGVLADVPEDRGAGVGQGVVLGWAVEEVPDAGGGLE